MDSLRAKSRNNMKINFANPSIKLKKYRGDIKNVISKIIDSNSYILGDEVKKFEKNFSKYIGSKYGLGVANGTDALEIGLKALGINKGDEVITVSHTAVATVAAIRNIGAKPVIVDIDQDFLHIDPTQAEKAITKKTKAIIAVHLYGQSTDIKKLISICKKNKIYLIEDVSQAHGAKYKGKKLGSFGIIGCFSCYPTKNLGAIGDAGIITTNNKKLFEKMKLLREYGWRKKFLSEIHGRNSRLDELQAGILNVKLKNLNLENKKRLKIANIYENKIKNKKINFLKKRNFSSHVFHLFVIKVENRSELIKLLSKNHISTGIHYPIAIHMQPGYKNSIKKIGRLINTEKYANCILSLPMYPELKTKEINKVVSLLNKF
mgnify:CR=1 FL=1